VSAPPAVPSTTRRRRLAFRLVGSALALGVALAAAEALLHLAPGLVPESFRQRFPPHGVEFFAPGVLDRTPVDGVPIPTGIRPFDGPPMHDLADVGVARAGIALDRRDVPRLVLPVDREGFVNAPAPAGATDAPVDLAILGDSFATLAGQSEPPGLVAALTRELGVRIHNTGVPGIGPEHELWLLRARALPRRPRVVLWFVYGGNDFINAYFLQLARKGGAATLADIHRDARRPTLLLPALAASWLAPAAKAPPDAGELPPVRVRGCADAVTWFHPDTLRFLGLSREALQGMPAWASIAATLAAGQRETAAAGARLLVVYLPGKEQAALPLLADDAGELLARYLARSSLPAIPVPAEPASALALLRANADALEQLVAAECAAIGAEFWSATAILRGALAGCAEAYYRADSHWRAEGQALVLPELARRLRALGLGRR
jgi:hypothetical protein